MIKRASILSTIKTALGRSRIVALIGPRQSGKTTLARQFVRPDSVNYFDLEDPVSLARLEQPLTALRDLHDVVVIDEIQRRPDLFPILRVLADRERLPARFLILGSASPELIRSSSESLAGRVETISISGFSLAEIGIDSLQQHWLRGGFPLSFLAKNDSNSFAWRKNSYFVPDLHQCLTDLHGLDRVGREGAKTLSRLLWNAICRAGVCRFPLETCFVSGR